MTDFQNETNDSLLNADLPSPQWSREDFFAVGDFIPLENGLVKVTAVRFTPQECPDDYDWAGDPDYAGLIHTDRDGTEIVDLPEILDGGNGDACFAVEFQADGEEWHAIEDIQVVEK